MQRWQKCLWMLGCFAWGHFAYAGTVPDTAPQPITTESTVDSIYHYILQQLRFRPILELTAGADIARVGSMQTYYGTDDRSYIYMPNNEIQDKGIIGGFLGGEIPLRHNTGKFQLGVEYDNVSSFSINGIHDSGQQPDTYTVYSYGYTVKSQQLMAVMKLLGNWHIIYHPYVTLGIGAAFNQSYDFNVATSETGDINLTPTFENNRNTAFTYKLGLGIDADVTAHLRLGAGYRFADLGQFSLGDGQVSYGTYVFPSPFTLGQSHIITNEVIAQLGYLF